VGAILKGHEDQEEHPSQHRSGVLGEVKGVQYYGQGRLIGSRTVRRKKAGDEQNLSAESRKFFSIKTKITCT